jgi:hypothetical protein
MVHLAGFHYKNVLLHIINYQHVSVAFAIIRHQSYVFLTSKFYLFSKIYKLTFVTTGKFETPTITLIGSTYTISQCIEYFSTLVKIH